MLVVVIGSHIGNGGAVVLKRGVGGGARVCGCGCGSGSGVDYVE